MPATPPRLLATLVVAALVTAAGLTATDAALLPDAPVDTPADAASIIEVPTANTYVAPPPLETGTVRHRIRSGETFGQVMSRYGVEQVSAVLKAAKPHKNLAKIRVDRELLLRFERGLSAATAVGYPLDEDNILWVDLTQAPPVAEVEAVVYERREGARSFTIEKTLWGAAIEAGLRAGDISRLASIFEYELDFNTELRANAQLALVMDELWREGEYIKPGDIKAVRLINRGETLTYYRHNDAWYAPDGTARKRQFLRSPLEFSRVTSGFNPKRFHPISRKVRAHNGTDFGAPTGTPVRATADGLVVTSSRNGGHGLYVKLDHDGPYHTSYSHLSKLTVKKGQRVKQGDLIGKVGSTGASTGPHLHYEFHIKGKAVDALKRVPDSGRPVPDSERAAFEAEQERLAALMAPLDG